MATTDTDTDYAINKMPLPLTAIAHPICSTYVLCWPTVAKRCIVDRVA